MSEIYSILNLSNLTGEGFVYAFTLIPKKSIILDISNCNLAAKKTEDIIKGFSAIPPNITVINMSGNALSNLSEDALFKILQSIPDTVSTLYLTDNGLNGRTGAILTRLLSGLKPNITVVNLSHNNLGISSKNNTSSYVFVNSAAQEKRNSAGDTTQRSKGSAAAPAQLTKKGSQIKFFMLPGAADTIEIPAEKTARKLMKAFKNMSNGVISLDLSSNQFNKLPGTLLADVFLSFPLSLKKLKFQNNNLGTRPEKDTSKDFSEKRSRELIQAFCALTTKNIDFLDISKNNLHELTSSDLTQVIFSIPPQITHIILSESDLAQFSDKEMGEIVKHLKKYNKVLQLNNREGQTSTVIKSLSIIDPQLIPSMFTEEARINLANCTLAEARSLAAAIHALIEDFLTINITVELYRIVLEYCNIALGGIKTAESSPNTLKLSASLTQFLDTPTPSPLATAATVTASPTPTGELQLDLSGPVQEMETIPADSGSAGKPGSAAAASPKTGAVVAFNHSQTKYTVGTMFTNPKAAGADESQPASGSCLVC